MNFYKIAVNFPSVNSILTYSFNEKLQAGQLVEVPLGKRKERGVVVSNTENESKYEIKPIEGVISDEFQITPKMLKLYQWMSQYYHYSMGKLIFDTLPKMMKRPKEVIFEKGNGEEFGFSPNTNQKEIINSISQKLGSGFSKQLIHGVTGSGKTLVYLQLIKKVIKQNKSALFLVPEINLTPQFTSEFKKYLDVEILSYHSGLTNSERFNVWKKLAEDGRPLLVLGVRSSIFLPIKNLGLIVVDEEHDSSFKQDDRCTYNSRDVAIKRASLEQIPVVLGSATPSIETFKSFNQTDDYYKIKTRAKESKLPQVEFIDLRDEKNEDYWPLHENSFVEIQEALNRGEQALVFVNKLGFSRFMQCKSCGHKFMCPNCSVNLTPYFKRNTMECHSCTYKEKMAEVCPKCSCISLMHSGFGTEKVQKVLQKLFPDKKIDRFDRDEIKNVNDLEKKLNDFHSGKIDLLVGTQMLSKGHNFERVNTVIILAADSQLNFPDFRSEERTYQLLTQITGRAGRFGKDSKVIIQTYQPELPLFQVIKEHKFDDFYFSELELRQAIQNPPYGRIVIIKLNGRFQNKVQDVATEVADKLRVATQEHFKNVRVLGPKPSMVEKRANKYTWNILLKSEDINQLHNLINTLEKNYKSERGVSIKLDIDPLFIN
jgi:primosomal protein N' (replication factor Y)